MVSQPVFKPSCPSGGSWYACGNGTKFTGCCGKDACTSTGCPAGLLYPASFDTSYYGKFTDQKCSDGSFYTCTGTKPPFLGCCKSNPCGGSGCPSGNLAAAYLSSNSADLVGWDPQPPLSSSAIAVSSSSTTSSSSTRSSSSSSSSTSTLSTSTSKSSSTSTSISSLSSTLSTSRSSSSISSTISSASSTATDASAITTPTPIPEKKDGPSVGAIAGGAAGGFALICAIIFLVWRVKYHTKRSSKAHGKVSQDAGPPEIQNAYTDNEHKGGMASVIPVQASRQNTNAPYSYQKLAPHGTAVSPSVAPPYSGYNSPVPGYSSPPLNQMNTPHEWAVEADSRNVYKPYSPSSPSPAQFNPAGMNQTAYDPARSSTTLSQAYSQGYSQGHSHSESWGDHSTTFSPYTDRSPRIQPYVRAHQGPPIELGDQNARYTGLGVHQIDDGYSPRQELGDGGRRPA